MDEPFVALVLAGILLGIIKMNTHLLHGFRVLMALSKHAGVLGKHFQVYGSSHPNMIP